LVQQLVQGQLLLQHHMITDMEPQHKQPTIQLKRTINNLLLVLLPIQPLRLITHVCIVLLKFLSSVFSLRVETQFQTKSY
jgi:hypothetical protein